MAPYPAVSEGQKHGNHAEKHGVEPEWHQEHGLGVKLIENDAHQRMGHEEEGAESACPCPQRAPQRDSGRHPGCDDGQDDGAYRGELPRYGVVHGRNEDDSGQGCECYCQACGYILAAGIGYTEGEHQQPAGEIVAHPFKAIGLKRPKITDKYL